MNQIFYDAVGNNPIIAAVKNMEDIEVSCAIEEIQIGRASCRERV